MIQRVQSVYLLMSIFMTSLFVFVFPYANLVDGGKAFAHGDYLIFGAPLLSVLVSLITIFLFKNRKLQINLCSVNQVLVLLSFGGLAYGFDKLGDQYEGLGFGVYAIALSFILITFAKKNIKKDKELVDSVDRIR